MQEFEMSLGCTGTRKRPHPLRQLGKVVLREDFNATLAVMGCGESAAGPDLESLNARDRNGRQENFTAITVQSTAAGRLWVVRCESCGREVRRREKQVVQVLRAAADSGTDALLNVSRWP